MILNYDELWEPYSVDGHTLDNSIRYLQKLAAMRGVSPFLVDIAVRQIFMEVAKGKEFPKDRCPCGCGIDKAGTAITHAMEARMFALDKEEKEKYARWLETRENLHSLGKAGDRMEEAWVALQGIPEKKETEGILKRIKDGLFRRRNLGSVPDADADS